MRRIRSHAGLLPLALLAAACTTISPPRVPPSPAPGDAGRFSHEAFDRVLREFVDARGRVDYQGLGARRRDLDRYYAQLAAASPDSHPALFPDDDARLAYWINAYNASAIELVLHHYPIESVEDLRSPALFFLPKLAGFFYLQRVELGGEKTNLYDLENGLIRPRFLEPRIHFALNCASRGCPRLPRSVFRPDGLQDQLERETHRFIAEERNVDIDPEDGEIELSAIFDWYAEDFVDWMKAHRPDAEPTLLGYIEPYLTPEQAEALGRCRDCEIEFADYDWRLNDQRQRDDDE